MTGSAALKDARLRSTKRAATGLLVLVSILYVAATLLIPRFAGMAYVAAACEAAMVGALADWFAVVALFRHPLNIPLPHTAILPKNKARIAQGLGEFIQEQFLSTPALVAKITEFDPASQLARWLRRRDNAELIAGYFARAASFGVEALDDARVREFLHRTLTQRLQKLDTPALVADLLEVLTANRRHHQLLDQALAAVSELLARDETRQFLRREIAGQMPMLKWVNQVVHLDEKAAAKLLEVAIARLGEVLADPEHDLRRRFDVLVEAFIQRLRTDPGTRAKVDQLRDELLANPAFGAYLWGLWSEFRTWISADATATDSTVKHVAADFVQTLGERLDADSGIRTWLNEQAVIALPRLVEEHRGGVGRFIERQINEWNDDTLVRELERNIGPDLQFIRINGTLVGGAAGLLIYSLTRLLASAGHVG